jgi:hypothetical protein
MRKQRIDHVMDTITHHLSLAEMEVLSRRLSRFVEFVARIEGEERARPKALPPVIVRTVEVREV